jgi:hypothetical protein
MTCHVDAYPYGYAGCCGCERNLDLSATPSCFACQKGNLVLYFYYCSKCFSSLQVAGREACGRAIGEVLEKVQPARRFGLAITTSLALQARGGDLVKAYEIGAGIPRVLHDAIVAGQAEAAIVPPFDWEA